MSEGQKSNGKTAAKQVTLAEVLARAKQLLGAKKPEAAYRLLETARAQAPPHSDIVLPTAIALGQLRRHAEAIPILEDAVGRWPGRRDLRHRLGQAYVEDQRPEDALLCFQTLTAQDATDVQAEYAIGTVQAGLGHVDEAVAAYRRALAQRPDFFEAQFNLAALFGRTGAHEEAVEEYNRVIAMRPDFARAHNDMGGVMRELARLDDALASYDQAITLDPGFADARANRAMLLMLRGDFADGFAAYEARKKTQEYRLRDVPGKLWLGAEDIADKRLFLHAEQGFGDTIQFCRYARLAEERGASVVMSVQDRLRWLMAGLGPGIEVIGKEETPDRFDLHVPLLSLPLAFGTRPDTIPAMPSYLSADPARVTDWAGRIGDTGLRVGIAWQGSTGKIDKGRSPPLSEYSALAGIPGVRLISLQKGQGVEQLETVLDGLAIETLGADFDEGPDGFADSAAVMAHLDLVITSDTAIAHLAGALGRPVWVALKRVPDWRWLLDGETSPWYPSMRLFRQPSPGDWPGVFARMATALGDLARARG